MLQGEHSAILLTFIKLQFVITIFVLSIFEWPLKTSFTVVMPWLVRLYGEIIHEARGLSPKQVDNHGITTSV